MPVLCKQETERSDWDDFLRYCLTNRKKERSGWPLDRVYKNLANIKKEAEKEGKSGEEVKKRRKKEEEENEEEEEENEEEEEGMR